MLVFVRVRVRVCARARVSVCVSVCAVFMCVCRYWLYRTRCKNLEAEANAINAADFRRRSLNLGARQEAYKKYNEHKSELRRRGIDPSSPEFCHLWQRVQAN